MEGNAAKVDVATSKVVAIQEALLRLDNAVEDYSYVIAEIEDPENKVPGREAKAHWSLREFLTESPVYIDSLEERIRNQSNQLRSLLF